ncbi:hypothetical protein ABIB56_000529 [Glaciihabitans sp. UYNi722]
MVFAVVNEIHRGPFTPFDVDTEMIDLSWSQTIDSGLPGRERRNSAQASPSPLGTASNFHSRPFDPSLSYPYAANMQYKARLFPVSGSVQWNVNESKMRTAGHSVGWCRVATTGTKSAIHLATV